MFKHTVAAMVQRSDVRKELLIIACSQKVVWNFIFSHPSGSVAWGNTFFQTKTSRVGLQKSGSNISLTTSNFLLIIHFSSTFIFRSRFS